MALQEIIALAAICTVGGFIQGLTGFGFAMVTSPVLMLFMNPVDAIFLNVTVSLAVGMLSFLKKEARGAIHRKALLILILGMLPGLVVGLVVVNDISADALRLWVMFVVAVSSLILLLGSSRIRWLTGIGICAGFISGFLTPTTAINGPPVVIYLSNRFDQKAIIRSTSLAYLLVAMVIAMVSMLGIVELGKEIRVALAWGGPSGWLGFLAGTTLFHRTSQAVFKRYVHCVLIVLSLAGIVSLIL